MVDTRGDLRRGKAQVARPHHLALAHRNSADDLCDIFAERNADEIFLDFAERSDGDHPFGIGGKLAHSLHIGGEPGQPMGGALFAIKQLGRGLAFDRHAFAHLDDGIGQQSVQCSGRLSAELDQFVSGGAAGSDDGHGSSGNGDVFGAGCASDTTRAVHKSKPARNWLVFGGNYTA